MKSFVENWTKVLIICDHIFQTAADQVVMSVGRHSGMHWFLPDENFSALFTRSFLKRLIKEPVGGLAYCISPVNDFNY